jgi:hypothetical protein
VTLAWTPSLILTDRTLFDRQLSLAAKVVLGVTLGCRERNASQRQLIEWTGLHESTVRAAQNELDAIRSHWEVDEDEELIRDDAGEPVEFESKFADLDRPKSARERNKNNPRFVRSTRLTSLWVDADPAQNPGRRTELPGAILERIQRGGKNRALLCLAALAYARVQLQHGAIQAPDEVVAWWIGAETGQAKRARQTLTTADVLARTRRRARAGSTRCRAARRGSRSNPRS